MGVLRWIKVIVAATVLGMYLRSVVADDYVSIRAHRGNRMLWDVNLSSSKGVFLFRLTPGPSYQFLEPKVPWRLHAELGSAPMLGGGLPCLYPFVHFEKMSRTGEGWISRLNVSYVFLVLAYLALHYMRRGIRKLLTRAGKDAERGAHGKGT